MVLSFYRGKGQRTHIFGCLDVRPSLFSDDIFW